MQGPDSKAESSRTRPHKDPDSGSVKPEKMTNFQKNSQDLVACWREEVDDLQEALMKTESSCNALRIDNGALREQLVGLDEKHGIKEEQWTVEKTALNERNDTCQKTITKLECELKRRSGEVESCQKEIAMYESKIIPLQEAFLDKKARLEKLESSSKVMKAELMEKDKLLQEAREGLRTSLTEIGRLKTQLLERDSMWESLVTEIRNMGDSSLLRLLSGAPVPAAEDDADATERELYGETVGCPVTHGRGGERRRGDEKLIQNPKPRSRWDETAVLDHEQVLAEERSAVSASIDQIMWSTSEKSQKARMIVPDVKPKLPATRGPEVFESKRKERPSSPRKEDVQILTGSVIRKSGPRPSSRPSKSRASSSDSESGRSRSRSESRSGLRSKKNSLRSKSKSRSRSISEKGRSSSRSKSRSRLQSTKSRIRSKSKSRSRSKSKSRLPTKKDRFRPKSKSRSRSKSTSRLPTKKNRFRPKSKSRSRSKSKSRLPTKKNRFRSKSKSRSRSRSKSSSGSESGRSRSRSNSRTRLFNVERSETRSKSRSRLQAKRLLKSKSRAYSQKSGGTKSTSGSKLTTNRRKSRPNSRFMSKSRRRYSISRSRSVSPVKISQTNKRSDSDLSGPRSKRKSQTRSRSSSSSRGRKPTKKMAKSRSRSSSVSKSGSRTKRGRSRSSSHSKSRTYRKRRESRSRSKSKSRSSQQPLRKSKSRSPPRPKVVPRPRSKSPKLAERKQINRQDSTSPPLADWQVFGRGTSRPATLAGPFNRKRAQPDPGAGHSPPRKQTKAVVTVPSQVVEESASSDDSTDLGVSQTKERVARYRVALGDSDPVSKLQKMTKPCNKKFKDPKERIQELLKKAQAKLTGEKVESVDSESSQTADDGAAVVEDMELSDASSVSEIEATCEPKPSSEDCVNTPLPDNSKNDEIPVHVDTEPVSEVVYGPVQLDTSGENVEALVAVTQPSIAEIILPPEPPPREDTTTYKKNQSSESTDHEEIEKDRPRSRKLHTEPVRRPKSPVPLNDPPKAFGKGQTFAIGEDKSALEWQRRAQQWTSWNAWNASAWQSWYGHPQQSAQWYPHQSYYGHDYHHRDYPPSTETTTSSSDTQTTDCRDSIEPKKMSSDITTCNDPIGTRAISSETTDRKDSIELLKAISSNAPHDDVKIIEAVSMVTKVKVEAVETSDIDDKMSPPPGVKIVELPPFEIKQEDVTS